MGLVGDHARLACSTRWGVDRLVLGVVNWGCLSKLEMTIQVNASRKGGKHMTINMSNYILGDDIPVDEMILGGIITLEQD